MSHHSTDVVILSAARTPIGKFQGALSGIPAPQLGAIALKAAVERAGIDPALLSEVIMGNVVPAGEGQAPARQAAIAAGVPVEVGATDDQQGLRLRTQGGHAGRSGHPCRRRRLLRRRRHGKHESGALPAHQSPFRLPAGQRRAGGCRRPRRVLVPVRAPAHGPCRRVDRRALRRQPAGAGRVRLCQPSEGVGSYRCRSLQARDRSRAASSAQGVACWK